MAAPDEEVVMYPGARAPDRRRSVDSHGVELAVYEWGDPAAPPLMLVHGGFDFARTFDVFAPLLADAGYRVVAWDFRGHGDSQHAELYSWVADQRDLLAVADSVSRAPFPVLGHSKGGALLLDIIEALPRRFTHFVAIDGLPFRGALPDAPEGGYTEVLHEAVTRWLDQREKAAGSQRKPGTLDELALRRARQNPRLGHDWLRYLVQQGARHDADGWRWKIDPSVGSGGFGPWRMGWTTDRLPGFPIPMLALIATELEQMGWEAPDIDITPLLPIHARAVFMQQTGHFIHIERPAESARLVLEFLRG